ncbi:MAG: DNA methyltransferase, partial [candidate division WOR-3 bacterium]
MAVTRNNKLSVVSKEKTKAEAKQLSFSNIIWRKNKFVNLRDAAQWASQYLNRRITTSNISYLLQYGKITKYGNDGNPLINTEELKEYYDSFNRRKAWENALGEKINWHLSFEEYSEAERTKHVHRLHPYKGKFIPQLVEYFLDSETDEFKKEVYFRPGDIVLDPFCGSGTTLVQANELGIHAIGIDISFFNALISNVKVEKHNIARIAQVISDITSKFKRFQDGRIYTTFENHLLAELAKFNATYFPSPEYKLKVRKGEIDENSYTAEKEREFLEVYNQLVKKYHIKVKQDKTETFMDKWFLFPVREEIEFLAGEIQKLTEPDIKNVLTIILSRTARSCRATTHADLATLKEPVTTTYY